MKRKTGQFVHPIDQQIPHEQPLPSEESADSRAKPIVPVEGRLDDSRTDPWEGRWIRFHIQPLWTNFLKKGISEQSLDAAHFKVFLLLTTLMGIRNEILNTQEEMAELTGIKPSRICEVLRDLEALGCIQRIGTRSKGAFIRIDPGLVTRSSRLTHLKSINEWDQENQRRKAIADENAERLMLGAQNLFIPPVPF